MHLFNKENIWSNPHASSHPDKHNNSVDRIISKEEEREDPRRDSSIYLRVQWCFHIPTGTTVFPHTIQQLQVILHTELILPQEILQLQGSSHTDQYKASSSDCSRVSKHSTWQNKAPGLPYSIPRPYSTSRLPVILGGRNSILGGRQHPRSPYSSSQAHSYKNSTRRNRIHSKGSSIVCPCNTKVSVFQFTYSCPRIILQEN